MLTVRQLARTVINMSRPTAIMFQLGTNEVRHLAITEIIASSFTIFRLGPLKIRQLAVACLELLLFILFQLEKNEVRQLAITTVIMSSFVFFFLARSRSGNWP